MPNDQAENPMDEIKQSISKAFDKIARITSCHATLLAMAEQFDNTAVPFDRDGIKGKICPEFAFPALLQSVGPDVENICSDLNDIEHFLDKIEGAGGVAAS